VALLFALTRGVIAPASRRSLRAVLLLRLAKDRWQENWLQEVRPPLVVFPPLPHFSFASPLLTLYIISCAPSFWYLKESCWLCTCGEAKSYPFCAGSHKAFNAANGTAFAPRPYKNEKEEEVTAYLCACGKTKNVRAPVLCAFMRRIGIIFLSERSFHG